MSRTALDHVLHSPLKRLELFRALSLVLGIWLFVSAFVLPHTLDRAMPVWILGALIAISSGLSFFAHEIGRLEWVFVVLLAIVTLLSSGAPEVSRLNEGAVTLALLILLGLSQRTLHAHPYRAASRHYRA